jgi:hypothetical protein
MYWWDKLQQLTTGSRVNTPAFEHKTIALASKWAAWPGALTSAMLMKHSGRELHGEAGAAGVPNAATAAHHQNTSVTVLAAGIPAVLLPTNCLLQMNGWLGTCWTHCDCAMDSNTTAGVVGTLETVASTTGLITSAWNKKASLLQAVHIGSVLKLTCDVLCISSSDIQICL